MKILKKQKKVISHSFSISLFVQLVNILAEKKVEKAMAKVDKAMNKAHKAEAKVEKEYQKAGKKARK